MEKINLKIQYDAIKKRIVGRPKSEFSEKKLELVENFFKRPGITYTSQQCRFRKGTGWQGWWLVTLSPEKIKKVSPVFVSRIFKLKSDAKYESTIPKFQCLHVSYLVCLRFMMCYRFYCRVWSPMRVFTSYCEL